MVALEEAEALEAEVVVPAVEVAETAKRSTLPTSTVKVTGTQYTLELAHMSLIAIQRKEFQTALIVQAVQSTPQVASTFFGTCWPSPEFRLWWADSS